MESRFKLFGHPVHPMLIVFPLGLLGTAAIFDAIWLVTRNPQGTALSFYLIAAGIIGGLLAAIPGFVDFLGIPTGTRAHRIALFHGAGNVVVVMLFAGSWWLRQQQLTQPDTLALVLSFGGVALALVTGWLGGELVDRLGVGVDPGAHLNAPSSLSGRAATSGPERPRKAA